MSRNDLTTYEEMLAEDPKGLQREELIVEVTEALARTLRTSGLTQSELAGRLGKSKGFVSQILGGGRNLTIGTLADVAGALGCKVHVQLRPRISVKSEQPAADLGRTPAHRASSSGRKV
jgi:transcriptional regulator with XRE-family HTH domain